jgi:hypothetical protein
MDQKNPKLSLKWKLLFPVIVIPILILANLWFGTNLLSFILTYKWVILMGVAGTILYVNWLFPEWVKQNKQNIRRSWYFFFMVGIVFIFHKNGFDPMHWQRYSLLAVLFIFVDLALILTPAVVKIGGTELGAVNEVETVNEEMKKTIVQTKHKSQSYTQLIDLIDKNEFGKQSWNDVEEYMYSLEEFLNSYGVKCRQDIKVYSKDDNSAFINDVGTNSGIELGDLDLELLTKKTIVQTEKENAIIPFSKLFEVFIIVVSEKEPVHQIDFDHIITLAIIHSWYQQVD